MRTRLFIFVSIVQSILFLGHWFVYLTVAHFLGGMASSWVSKLAFGLLSVSFVLASLVGWYSRAPLVRLFYTLAAVWLGLASFLLVASVLCWLAFGIARLAGLSWTPPIIGGVLFGAAVLFSVYGIVNAAWLRVTRVSVTLENLPPQWRGRTAALISDLHLGHIRNYRFVNRIVKKLAALQPDVIFIAGDLYDGVSANFERLAAPWQALTNGEESVTGEGVLHRPPLGVYYIAGNHEEFYSHAEYLPPLLRSGIRVLNNEKTELDGVQLIGVHYRDAAIPDRYLTLLQGMKLDRSRPSVLLLHAPVRLPISEAEGVSLQLSGHTHGGQFFPGSWVAKRVWGKFNHGLQSFGKLFVFTSYGAGTWGPPMRVGTRPELVLIKFE